jgi:hypothetical protein
LNAATGSTPAAVLGNGSVTTGVAPAAGLAPATDSGAATVAPITSVPEVKEAVTQEMENKVKQKVTEKALGGF